MNWISNAVTNSVKERCCAYLIERYFGQFFERKLNRDQLSVDLSKKEIILTNITLDVQALNELADKQNWPLEFVDGSIDQLFVHIPWTQILTDISRVEVSGLKLTLQPKQRDDPVKSMFESMWDSMSSSLHLAQECADQQPTFSDTTKPYEGLAIVAQTIETILSNVRVKFVNTTLQFEHLPRESTTGVGLIVNIDLLEYRDEAGDNPPKDEATNFTKQEDKKTYFERSYTTRLINMNGIKLSTLEFSCKSRTFAKYGGGPKSNLCTSDQKQNIDLSENDADDADDYLSVGSSSDDERHIVLFGQFTNALELKIRLKKSEIINGAKVYIEMHFNSLILMLSPRQFNVLLELAEGLRSPEIEDHSNVNQQRYVGKPMSSMDYQIIEQDLQQQLQNKIGTKFSGLYGLHGWSTASLDESESDDNFLPIKNYKNDMYESDMSLGSSSMESSVNSTNVTSICTENTSHSSRKMHKIDTDPTAEISHFDLHLTSLVIILLHEDIINVSLKESCKVIPSSIEQSQKKAELFFKQIGHFMIVDSDLVKAHEMLDKSCQLNHLRLLAAPIHVEGDEKTTNNAFSISGHLEATKLSLMECLFKRSESKFEHIPMLIFNQTSTFTSVQPDVSLNFRSVERKVRSVSDKRNELKTDFSFSLSKTITEVDITILDRIAALLNSPPICSYDKSNDSFNVIERQHNSNVDLKITSPNVSIKLRFPTPDFRPPHDMNKIPWWKRNVRQDYLLLNLSTFTFHTSIKSDKQNFEYAIKCRGIEAFYCENEENELIPIAKGGFDENQASSLEDIYCRFHIKYVPQNMNEIRETPPVNNINMSTMSGIFENKKHNLGPFTSRTLIHDSYRTDSNAQKDDTEELLLPNDKNELDDFIRTTMTLSRVQLNIFLPTVSMQLLSKHYYEIIYNRINNDLLLWESNAPKPKTKIPVYDSNVFDYENNETFTLCKSGVQYECSSESEGEDSDDNTFFYSTINRRSAPEKAPAASNTTTDDSHFLSLNLQIGHGLLCLFTPARDATSNNAIPEQHGEFLVSVENGNFFLVNGYQNNMDLGYMCLQVNNGQLYHSDMVQNSNTPNLLKEIGSTPGKHLNLTISKSESGILADSKNIGGNREMLTLAIKIQANHETHHVKKITISAGLNKITLKHRMCNEPNSWITQLIDFFNVQDYPILGYVSKDVVTELYLHFWDSAIDYRPKYLPLRSVITFRNFSISSHLSTEMNTSLLRFLAEDCNLFLSNVGTPKNGVPYSGATDLRKDFVNVIDVGFFEISLKTTDKRRTTTPHIDLKASNDKIEIKTCADTAKALAHLLKYLANNGDLIPPEDITNSGSSYSSPRHSNEQELVVVEPKEVADLSKSQHERVTNLLSDALKESLVVTQELNCTGGTEVFYFPDENQILNNDANVVPHVPCNLTTSLGDEFEDSDDFCFIDEEMETEIFPKNGEPIINWLTNDSVRLVENHFTLPIVKSDPLKIPKDFPVPSIIYSLSRMSIIWYIFGGNDFRKDNEKKNVNFTERPVDTVRYTKERGGEKITMSNDVQMKKKMRDRWHFKGGVNRHLNVLMEFHLNKIRFQHEVYPKTSMQTSRQILLISEFEIKDRLDVSEINKFLYQQTTEERPKQSNADMISVKILNVRPDPKLNREECCLKVSILPLRFNIDQDALLFLISFFGELGDNPKEENYPGGSSKNTTPVHQPPVMTLGDDEDEIKEQAKKFIDENLLILLDENSVEDEVLEDNTSTSSSSADLPVFFRNIIFAPDVPIQLDYHGKRLDMTHGSIPGILMGLAQLNCSKLKLKRITHRHGLLGVEKLFTFLLKEWLEDIKKNQLQSLLGGVGPIASFVTLFKGVRDLFWLPFEQYKKDGRFLRGLHRGANSFTTSTAVAALELTTRLIHLIQMTAETAFDMLTPGPSVRMDTKIKHKKKRYQQPRDLKEGMTNALLIVKQGFEETADRVVRTASREHEHKGYSGAVGGVLRQIAPTVIQPFITVPQAAHNLLDGARNQLVPDANKEAKEKWRHDDMS